MAKDEARSSFESDGNGLSKKQRAFLAAYAELANITDAAKAAQVARSMHYVWLQKSEEYAEAFRHAEAEAIDALEKEARRRALHGVNEPVFYQGEECGAVRKYSDTLLIFLLKGARPDTYRENFKAELTGPNGGPVVVRLEGEADKWAK